ISDLSWLNPTPHAIAVYASRPLSPVATQHSLPSRSYPLLGPDLHRLDRTSLRLAHLFGPPNPTRAPFAPGTQHFGRAAYTFSNPHEAVDPELVRHAIAVLRAYVEQTGSQLE